MKIVSKFIDTVVKEKDGYKFSEAWQLNEDSLNVIVPVLRKKKAKKRKYITLAEAKDVEMSDTGQIDYVYVKNNEKKPLLISRGEIFRGKTQERAAVHGHIVEAGKGSRVSVRCIHNSKGIVGKAKMEYGGKTPYAVNLTSQRNTWESIRNYTSGNVGIGTSAPAAEFNSFEDLGGEMQNFGEDLLGSTDEAQLNSLDINEGVSRGGTSSMSFTDNTDKSASAFHVGASQTPNIGGDNLVASLAKQSEDLREIMKKIPFIENQAGVVFIYDSKIKGLEIYDVSESWSVVKEDVVEKEGSDFQEKESDNLFEFKPSKVKKMLGKKLGVEFSEKSIYKSDDYEVIEIKEKADKKSKLVGEAVVLKDEVIHLTMYRV